MVLVPYLNFNGNCRDAVAFYEEVFGTEKAKLITFSDLPENPDFPMPKEAKNLIMHAELEICGSRIMFSDLFPGAPFTSGGQISIAIISDNKEKLKQYFLKLREGGTVEMEPGEVPWSGYYGSLVDRYGVNWQLNLQL